MASVSAFETDALRPAPSVTQSRPNYSENLNSADFLDAVEEDWNSKVDAEIETLVEGMTELVDIAAVEDKDKFRVSQDAFEAECRAENMVRAAHSLLSITHSLKLMILLSDEAEAVKRREDELTQITVQMDEARRKASSEWRQIVSTANNKTAPSMDT